MAVAQGSLPCKSQAEIRETRVFGELVSSLRHKNRLND